MSEREIIGLKELQSKIKEVVEGAFPLKIWVKAETGEVKENSSGHCYIDLIEKEEGGSRLVAKMQAIIWSSRYKIIKPFFTTTTGKELERGMNIMVCVTLQYSQLYGISLVITDIDPSFTVGEQELERQKTIEKLKKEGMMELNSAVEMALLPRRVAVISAESAAGYRDFIKQLHNNDYGFKFYTTLFPAPMQGDTAPRGISEALGEVASREREFDVTIILRGGGGVQDLICFDNYDLALHIAQFPLPVITAIGHDHDFHVADMVAYSHVKTPTAAAVYLLEIFATEQQQIAYLSRRLNLALQGRLESERNRMERGHERIFSALKNRAKEMEHQLNLLEARVVAANPVTSLERGYALVYSGGKRVLSAHEVQNGSEIVLAMKEGRVECEVKNIVTNQ